MAERWHVGSAAEGCNWFPGLPHHRLPEVRRNVAEGRVAVGRPEVAKGTVDVPATASPAHGGLVRGELRLHCGAMAFGPVRAQVPAVDCR
eukprot:1988436-Lingulodinium_polyedra.AAC.1